MSAVAAGRPDHAREIRYALTDARELCAKLGLLDGKGSYTKQAGGLIIRCPWHPDKTPSCSVRRAKDGTIACRCHACGSTGDALSIIAQVHGLSVTRDFREVLRVAADLAGLHAIVHELDTGAAMPERPRVAPPKPLAEERDYPPAASVERLWAETLDVTEVAPVAAWLTSRRIDPNRVAAAGVARAIQDGIALPRWAVYQGRSWRETGHRLIVAMHDAAGVMRSVRAGRVVEGEAPKRLPPAGHKAAGLVMACELGVGMLRGAFRPDRVAISEGEPDFLTHCATPGAIARIGIVSGSWTPAIADRFPVATEIFVRTDSDTAGDAYAAEIAASLNRRCFVRRVRRTA